MADGMFNAYAGEEPYFFVCYSHADADTVYADMRWLHTAGVNLWYDEGIEAGTTWRRAVAEALANAAGVIFMCSAQSQGSTHCRKEVSYALDHDKPIFVVRLDRVELTAELALYLNDTQLLERDGRQPDVYRQKLLTALGRHVAVSGSAAVTPVRSPRRRILPIAVLISLAALIALGTWLTREPDGSTQPSAHDQVFDFPRVAILPMEILTPDDALEFLSLASTDDLRSRMQASIYVPVNVPPSAVDMDVAELGQSYDVDYVWYRSVAKRGEQVRISKRLVETKTSQDVKVIQRDLHGSEPFDLQDQMASYFEDIMGALDRAELERADRIPLRDMNARDLTYTSKGDRRANIQRALALEPDLFSANSAMADLLFEDYVQQRTDTPEQTAAEALRLARRGRALAPFDQYANQVAAKLEMSVGNIEAAYSYASAFLKLKSISSYPFYDVLIASGRIAEGLEHASHNPLVRSVTRGSLNLAAGNYRAACEQYRAFTVEQPRIWESWFNLANCLGYLDEREEVASIMQGLRDAGFHGTVAQVEVGIRRYWGKSEFADVALNGLKRLGYE